MLKIAILIGAVALVALIVVAPLPNLVPSNLLRPTPTSTPVPLSTWLSADVPKPQEPVEFRGRPLDSLKLSDGTWRVNFRAEGFDQAGRKTAAMTRVYTLFDPAREWGIGQCMHVSGVVTGQASSGEVEISLPRGERLLNDACY